MQPTFDPIRKRQFWLDFNLPYETRFEPDEIPVKGQPIYLSTMVNSLLTAYLLGLADRVRPTLQAIVAWMDSRPVPDVHAYDEPWEHWRDGWYARYAWWRTAGVCRWLCGIGGFEEDFDRALEAEWLCWEQADPDDAERDFYLRQEALSEHLAVALAARAPRTGLQFRTAAGIEQVSADQPKLLFLEQWACLYLEVERKWDRDFVAGATKLLRGTLCPDLLSTGRLTEAALLLKSFYGDSGVAKTPEQVMARAYDFMPVARPDFVVP